MSALRKSIPKHCGGCLRNERKCSTCDMNCVINNGLSEASKEQLKHKTGEEIVDADIAQQMETK